MNYNNNQDLEFSQLKEMGFSNEQIQKAREKASKEKKNVLNILLETQQYLLFFFVLVWFFNYRNLVNIESPSSRIEDPEQRKRIKSTPVGLKNVGNSNRPIDYIQFLEKPLFSKKEKHKHSFLLKTFKYFNKLSLLN